MFDDIVKIIEITDIDGAQSRVNDFLGKGWKLINVLNCGTNDAMDIYYILGANQEVYDNYENAGIDFEQLIESLRKPE